MRACSSSASRQGRPSPMPGEFMLPASEQTATHSVRAYSGSPTDFISQNSAHVDVHSILGSSACTARNSDASDSTTAEAISAPTIAMSAQDWAAYALVSAAQIQPSSQC